MFFTVHSLLAAALFAAAPARAQSVGASVSLATGFLASPAVPSNLGSSGTAAPTATPAMTPSTTGAAATAATTPMRTVDGIGNIGGLGLSSTSTGTGGPIVYSFTDSAGSIMISTASVVGSALTTLVSSPTASARVTSYTDSAGNVVVSTEPLFPTATATVSTSVTQTPRSSGAAAAARPTGGLGAVEGAMGAAGLAVGVVMGML